MSKIGRACIACAAALASLSASALELQSVAAKDNTLFSQRDDFASGAGDFLFVGNTAGGASRRTLLQFDLSAIPQGATITSVSLRIFVDRNGSASSPADMASLHTLSADWGEGMSNAGTGGGGTQASPGDATWTHRFYGDPPSVPRLDWSVAGGDFAVTASGQTVLSSVGAITFASTAALVSDVQGWLADPAGNFGWMMLGNESSDQNARRFFSRSSADIPNRPMLSVTYTAAIPEPGTWALLFAGTAVVLLVAHRGRTPTGERT